MLTNHEKNYALVPSLHLRGGGVWNRPGRDVPSGVQAHHAMFAFLALFASLFGLRNDCCCPPGTTDCCCK